MIRSGASGPRVIRSEIALPSELEVRCRPPVRRCHQLLAPDRACVLSFIARRDSGFANERKDDAGRDAGAAAVSRWADAGDRQAGGFRGAPGAERRREPGGSFRRAALRVAALAGARPPARPRLLRLLGARAPSQGAGRIGTAVQEWPRRQDLLGGGGRWARGRRRPHRAPARPEGRNPGLVDEAGPAGAAGGDDLEGAGAFSWFAAPSQLAG